MTIAAEVTKTTRDFIGTTRRMLIDGQWVEAASGKTFVTTDPATEQEITNVAHGEAEDSDVQPAGQGVRAAVGRRCRVVYIAVSALSHIGAVRDHHEDSLVAGP
jgi:acyl-CoA reductase-like NAD-dependent aldehyde dehydrogenase